MPRNIEKLVSKVEQCIDYQSLYELEKDFNGCGLTLQTTTNNRMILCKLREGKAVTENVIDDYIFLGSLANSIQEMSDRAATKIGDFIRNNHGESGKVQNMARQWRNGLRMYNAKIAVVNEDVNAVADNMILG